MTSQWFTAITAVVSLVIGAAVQHLLANRADVRKARQALVSQAFVDMCRAVATLSVRGRDESVRHDLLLDATTLLADARTRIAIYGCEATVKALAAHKRAWDLSTNRGQELFVELCRQIRNEVGQSSSHLGEDLHAALFRRTADDGDES